MIQLEFIEDHDVCMKLNGDFVELFKKSFRLYVESGMIKKVEVDILRDEQGGRLVTKDSDWHCKAEFYKFITGRYLRKFKFFLHLTHLIT